MKENIDIEILLDILSKNEIIIYGCGHVGMKFYKALKMRHMEEHILCFAISQQKENLQEIEGIPVYEITNVNERRNTIVCIAAHEVLKDEICGILRDRGFREYIWIYPFLYELLLGAPVARNVSVHLDRIMRSCVNDYRFAVRYMAIEQYFGKNRMGYDVYVRAEALHCGRETSKRRLQNFCRLIHSFEQSGYEQESKILINTNYEIVDGNHRIATARYFGIESITCDIFSANQSVTEIHGKNAMLTEEALRDGGFCRDEIDALDAINKKNMGEYYGPD